MVAAVSGGSDSLALLHLLKTWRDCRAPALAITAVTIDHSLRAEAAAEALEVAAISARLNITHLTKTWDGPKPSTAIAQGARLARYRLLADAAAKVGADMVLTGHTMDDQAETVAMRGARGEGRGGAGMARATLFEDRIWIVRPLLGTRREALRAALTGLNQSWIDDPSNESETSERVRVRRALAAKDDAVERLAARAGEAAAERANANQAAARILSRAQLPCPGLVHVPADLMLDGGEAALLALRALTAAVGGAQHLPDEAATRKLLQRLASEQAGGTLAHTAVAVMRGALWFHREARGLPQAGRVEEGALWDGRFRARAEVMVAPCQPVRARAAVEAFDALPRRLVAAALAAEPCMSETHPPLTRIVPPWATFLPGFDITLRNAVARLVGAAPVPASPADAAPSK